VNAKPLILGAAASVIFALCVTPIAVANSLQAPKSDLSAEQEPSKPFTEEDFDANVRQVLERDAFPVLDNPPVVGAMDVKKQISASDPVGEAPITVSW